VLLKYPGVRTILPNPTVESITTLLELKMYRENVPSEPAGVGFVSPETVKITVVEAMPIEPPVRLSQSVDPDTTLVVNAPLRS